MWAAQALKRDYAVSMVSAGSVDLGALNRFYGTSVSGNDIVLRPLSLPRLLAQIRGGDAIRGAFFARLVRAAASDYDVLLSAYNIRDFGVPGVHCIADFSWDEEIRRDLHPSPNGARRAFHSLPWLRASYLGLCRAIAPPSGRNFFAGEDLIVANSRWTAARLREKYGAEATVLYPPVVGDFFDAAFEQRSDDFVCVGRVSPEKRIERMIRIVGKVRSRGHEVRIRIIGALDISPYSRMIGSLAEKNPDWVLLEGGRFGEEKTRILTECRYGIHGCEGEAFGIAVAEMVKAGCITFAPAEGGQAEIVDHPVLLYSNEDEAAEKVVGVLKSHSLRDRLRHHLSRQGERFSADNFVSGLREVVERFIASRRGLDSLGEEPARSRSVAS